MTSLHFGLDLDQTIVHLVTFSLFKTSTFFLTAGRQRRCSSLLLCPWGGQQELSEAKLLDAWRVSLCFWCPVSLFCNVALRWRCVLGENYRNRLCSLTNTYQFKPVSHIISFSFIWFDVYQLCGYSLLFILLSGFQTLIIFCAVY